MAQELLKLVKDQAKAMPEKALLDVSGEKVRYNHEGQEGTLTLDELAIKGPKFFDHYYSQVRSKVQFGAKVHGWLTTVEKKFKKDYKCKPLHELIWCIAVFAPAELRGFQQQEGSEESE